MNDNKHFDSFTLPNPIIEIGKIKFKEALVCYDIEVTRNNIYFQWHFGMDDSFPIGINAPLFFTPHTIQSDWKVKLTRWCEYNIGHAFFHPCDASNYSHSHWALYGNLKPLVEEIDNEYS